MQTSHSQLWKVCRELFIFSLKKQYMIVLLIYEYSQMWKMREGYIRRGIGFLHPSYLETCSLPLLENILESRYSRQNSQMTPKIRDLCVCILYNSLPFSGCGRGHLNMRGQSLSSLGKFIPRCQKNAYTF